MSILDKVVRTEERSFLCTHEETDSPIFFHILSLENQCCNQNSRHRLSYHWTWVSRFIIENTAGGRGAA